MCLLGQTSKPCNHPDCLNFYSKASPQVFPPIHTIIESLISTVLLRQPLLSTICHTTQALISKAEDIQSALSTIPVTSASSHPFYTKNSYKNRIVLASSELMQIYKEKGFSLTIQVVNDENNKVIIQDMFKIKLYTNDNPPKLLKLNIASKKILRGTLEAMMDENGIVVFPNVVINEVSSHYVKESFMLVITSESEDVKPLIVENLYVRARNSKKNRTE
ncbi:hypothetical protein SteCoe_25280 [Stentor coeruleus]|uniref:Uncharacterized protein n=1 Tax=Stentor coeruleus TaxID=5963 RepID=A0A1R2BFJ3_9CILI|nr:hypothetical protein SteCoe_25280 [Stentor coeruleus]